jgi:hypothetical protein
MGPAVVRRGRSVAVRGQERGQCREGEAAESSCREAIDRLSRSRLRPELARSHLNYALAADHPDRVDRLALAEIPGSPAQQGPGARQDPG